MQALLEHHPELRPNFSNSVFASATVNFGPRTCTYEHRDCANLPYGWCAITALGVFDHKAGGHLVLWDLKIVIEFPAGATVLIPSATLRHSNTDIGPDEERLSFTQYTAGGLFRWVDQGFQPSSCFIHNLADEEREEVRKWLSERWTEGLSLFSTVDELRQGKMTQ